MALEAQQVSSLYTPTLRQLSSIFSANLRVEASCANGGMTFIRVDGPSNMKRNGIPSKVFLFASRFTQITLGSDNISRYWLPLSVFLFKLSRMARASAMAAFMLEKSRITWFSGKPDTTEGSTDGWDIEPVSGVESNPLVP